MSNEAFLVELAHKRRLLTKKQARLVLEQLEKTPRAVAGELMLERHYITTDQLSDLRTEANGETVAEQSPPAEEPSSPGQAPPFGTPEPAADPSYQQPSVSDTQRARQQARQAVPEQEEAPPPEPRPDPEPAPPPPQPEPPREPVKRGSPEAKKRLARLLHIARGWGASDLHIAVGRPPVVRMDGSLREMEEPPMEAEECEALAFAGLRAAQAEEAEQNQQFDFSLEIPKLGRHRCAIFRHRLGWDSAFRIVPTRIPTLADLGLPDSLRQFTEHHQGMVLVAGPGGSGKTSTAAALLDLVNANRQDHIITVEDPVEYVFAPKSCQIMQREIGRHTQSFGNALRAALREDPDILLIGEMRDLETAAISISAAETGHLVFATLNTGSAARTVSKLVDFYPSSQQKQVQTMVSESLRGIVSQQLIPRIDTEGQAIAAEVLVNTTGVAQQIKEGKTQMITSLIQSGKKQGMMLMDESLLHLARGGYISSQEAYRRASNKKQFEGLVSAGGAG